MLTLPQNPQDRARFAAFRRDEAFADDMRARADEAKALIKALDDKLKEINRIYCAKPANVLCNVDRELAALDEAFGATHDALSDALFSLRSALP